MIINWRTFLLMGLALLIWVVPVGEAVTPKTHQITLHADQYSYTPSRVRVNQGDRVVITLLADDVAHGFYLDGYELDQIFVPGISQVVEFEASQTGKFRFRCSVVCGDLHPFMIGELVVGPNQPFVLAVKASLTLVLLAFIWLMIGSKDKEVFWSS